MRVLKAHLFVMLDVAVGSPLQPVDKEILQRMKSNSGPPREAFEKLMDDGSDWLFYGKGYTDEHGSHQRVEVLYGEDMRWPVPKDTRTPRPQAKAAGNSLGRTRICLHPNLGLGVVTFWKTLIADGAAGEVDALGAKLHADTRENQYRLREALKEWGFPHAQVGRITTVLTVQVDTDNLDDFVSSNSNAENIGRLFTGDEELERSSKLAAYATDADVSGRRFERIYVRWTDALAVYDTTTDLMDPASMRVVRLVETGILMRRLLRETAFEAEKVMSSIRPWTFPWLARSQERAEHLRRTMAEADLTTSVAPPIHSVEGGRLLAQTLAAFDVPRLHKDVRHALSELDRRLEWQRVRWLAVVAVLVFLANAAIAIWK
jgi:hypothetical protein